MLVLGVDPGSRVTGYGLVETKKNDLTCIHYGHITAPQKLPFYERIHNIFEKMADIMAQYRPHEMAIEDVFYSKNVKSSLKLGHARGAVLIAAAETGVKIYEYAPLEIKKSLVGYGRATKEQVCYMVQMLLKLKTVPNLDVSDALAAAITHINYARFRNASKERMRRS